MGIAKRREFRDKCKIYLEKNFGDLKTDYYFFLKERHFKRSKNKFIIVLKNHVNDGLKKVYEDAVTLGIDLHFLTPDPYWQAVILLFNNEEDYILFKLQFKDHISFSFYFQDIHIKALEKYRN